MSENKWDKYKTTTPTINKWDKYKSSSDTTTEEMEQPVYTQVGRDKDGFPIVTVKEYNELKPQLTALDSMFSSIKPMIEDLQTPINTTDIYGNKEKQQPQPTIKNVLGIELPKIEDKNPYKSLLKSNIKSIGLTEQDLQNDGIRSLYAQQKVIENTANDINFLKNASVPEISSYITDKKKRIDDAISEETEFDINKPLQKGESLLSNYISDKINLKSEYNTIKYDLDKIAQDIAFEKAPVLSKDIQNSLKLTQEQLLKQAEQVGNNIINSGNNVNRVEFEATSDLSQNEGGYNSLYKNRLAYTGIQAELNNTSKLLDEDSKLLSAKIDEISQLKENLQKDPTDVNLIEQLKVKIQELTPIKQSIDEKKQFISKLNQATFGLSAIKEQIDLQKKADDMWQTYEKMPYWSALKLSTGLTYGVMGLSNRLSNTLKGGALISNEISKSLGRDEQEVERIKANLLATEVAQFTLPTIQKEGKIVEFKDGEITPKVNWDLVLPMAAQQTAETLLMGGAASKFGTSLFAKAGGLYAGSAMVFSGDILTQELNKGLNFGDALAVTAGKLGIEAATEMINPLEFLPFNGITKKLGGFSKNDYINWVGNNWKTLLPKLKAKGINLKNFLFELGKQSGMESFEEVMSDLGNYGLDEFIINNIKPDYSKDGEFTLESEMTTFLSTMLTMLPMAGYGAIAEHKSSTYAPYLRWQASQNSSSFLENLKNNLDGGYITPEFYETGKKEVETLANLYNLNKVKVDAVDEDVKVDYLDAIYNLDVLQKQLTSETDEKKIEQLAKDIEKASLKVNSFDKDALENIKLTPIERKEKEESKQEQKYLDNLEDFASEQKLKSASKEDLQAALTILQDVVNNPHSEKVKEEALKQIDKINKKLSEKTVEKSVLEQTKEEINSLPKEELSNLFSLSAVKKKYPNLKAEEQKEIYNLVKQKQEQSQEEEKTINFQGQTFKIGDQVTTDNGKSYWYVQGVENDKLKLSRKFDVTSETTSISDVKDVTPYTKKEEQLQETEEQRSKNKETVKNAALQFKIGNTTAIWNTKTQSFEFYSLKFDKKEANLNSVALTLSQKPNILNTWWDSLLSNKAKDEIVEAKNTLFDLFYKTNGIVDVEPQETPEIFLLKTLRGATFSMSDKKDLTDVSDKWFKEGERTISDLASVLINDSIASEGVLANLDEQEIEQAIKDIISEYPNGITKKDIEKAIYESDTNSNDVLELEEEIALKFGVDIQTVVIKLGDQINEYEEKRRIEKETEEEDLSKGTPVDREDVQQTEEVIPQEVSSVKPQEPEKAKKQQDKEVVEKFQAPANPFKNGKVKSSNWNNVLSTIKNITDYRVKIIDTKSLKFEHLPFNTQKYFEKEATKNKTTVEDIISKDGGKMLVLTNKEGEIQYFEGFPVVSNFPDGELNQWKESYEKQGLTEEQYLDKLEQIKEARKINATLLINKLSNYPVQITQDNTNLGAVVGEQQFSIKKGSKGFPSAFIGDQEIPLASRKLSQNEIEAMIFILFKRMGESGAINNVTSDKGSKVQFVEKLILTGTGVGKINFKADGKTRTWEITIKQPDGSWKTASEQEVRDFLSKQYINIDYNLANKNTPFYTYKMENGELILDKKYEHYLDFLKDNLTTKGVSATKLQDNFYIEVGDIDNTLSAKIEEAKEQPKQEVVVEQKPIETPSIEEESPAVDNEFKDILNKQKKKDEEKPDKDDFTGLLRNKSLSQKVTQEQINQAKEWFKNSPISNYISLNHFQNIVNSDAYATWVAGAVTLWKGSEFTDLYHESWHEFSQLFLTKAQKKALYNELRESNSKFKNYTDKQIEEEIAEDFRNYVLSNQKLILNNRVKRNTIFRKIYNFLKELITGNVDLQTYYERLYTGNISNYKRNLNNAFWGNLNSEKENGIELSSTDTKNLYRGIDSLIGTIFEQNSKPITMMFTDSNVINVVYSAIYKRFTREYNDLLESVQNKLKTKLTEEEKEKLRGEVKTLNNLEYVINNWTNIISNHKKYSPFFNISKDKLTFDEDGNVVVIDDQFDDTTDEGNDRDSSIIKNENVSSKEAASNETIFTIATLPKYNADGTRASNKFLPFIQDVVDFNSTWDALTTITNNTLEYNQIFSKIEELGKANKSFQDLVKRIPNPNSELNNDSSRLKSAFVNDISKPLVQVYELVFTPNDKGGIRVNYQTAASSDEQRIKNKWFENFAQSSFLEEQEDGELIVNKDRVREKYRATGTTPAFFANQEDYNRQSKQTLFENRIQFLEDLGITFSNETLSNPEFQELVVKDHYKIGNFTYHSPIYAIYDLLTTAKNDISSLKDLSNVKPSFSGFKFFNSALEELAKFELENSQELFAQSVKNAEQNNVWQIRQWSYITKVFNALNDVEKYPTYDELQKEEWLQQFNFEVNPYVKGIYLNTFFDLNPKSPTYKQRRIVKKGVYPKISLHDYNGLRLNNNTSIVNEGSGTTSLTPFEKLVQNINSLLLENTQENLRYGDKSSSYSTKISHVYNPVTGKLEERDSIIPLISFISNKETVVLPKEAYNYLLINLRQEIIPMQRYYNDNIGVSLKHYNKNIKKLGTFDGILSKETKEIIQKQIVETNISQDEIDVILKSLPIREELEKYITSKTNNLSKLLDTQGLLEDKEFLDSKLLGTQKEPIHKTALLNAYVVNSLLYNMEHTKIVSFDPRFYKNPKDVFKRLSAFSATGNLFVVDDQTNNYIQFKGMAIRDAVAKKLKIQIPHIFPDGKIRSVIFKDNEYSATKLLQHYKESFLKTGKYTSEQLDKILKAYTSINEADGQGFITLDILRESKLRAGSSHWTPTHEKAYQKEAAFLAGESTEGMSQEEKDLIIFSAQKWQQAGMSLDENGTPFPSFYKFSVVPLIPSAIKNTAFEKIHDNLVRQNAHLALFESGSKDSAVQELQYNEDDSIKLDDKGNPIGQFNPFYEDYETRTPYIGDYTINTIYFQYLKEQVNVDPSLKGESTFSTQMRKLLHLNLFNNGVPNDVKLSYGEWFKLSESERLKQSDIYKSEQKFGDVIDNLIKIEQQSLLSKMGATLQKDGTYKLDAEKLQSFFKEEFLKRDLPNEVINYLQIDNGEFIFPFDAFKKRDVLERIAYSIANKKLVQQKITGEALVQVASTGFELSDKLTSVKEDSDIPFYEQEFDKDGNPLPTKAQKVKIAFTKRWRPLLNLTYKGQKIKTLDRLNEAVKDEEWLNTNRKAITIVGVRIPVQGLNSQEFMEVFHFLPESAGGVIVVSPALVAKSGGDFDIDKLTTFFPNLSKSGQPITKKSEEELKKQYNSFVNKYKKEDKAVDKLISDIFGITEEELQEELIQELIENKEIVPFEKFKNSQDKKAYENELIDIIRETLSRPDNFNQLVRPNDTDLLNNDEYGAGALKKIYSKNRDNTFTSVVDFESILQEFVSNLVGKSNLGIAAVNNVFFALAQRAGLYLNNGRYKDNSSGRLRDFAFYLPHNTVKIGDEEFVSLSGLDSKNAEYHISDVISQFINGFVDVAKDDWVFFINGVKEFIPTMLYTTMAGVNAKTNIAFFNQPIMHDYISQVQKYKNLFLKNKDKNAYNLGVWLAVQDAVLKYSDVNTEFLDEKERAKQFFEIKKAIEKSVKPDFLNEERLSEALYGNKPLSNEEQIFLLLHYYELKKQAAVVSDLQRSLNADTKKKASSYAIIERQQLFQKALDSGLISKEAAIRMKESSTIKAFTNSKTGFDTFVSNLYAELFELVNHPLFNKSIKTLIDTDKDLKFENKFANLDKYISTLKNDFITYLYHNHALDENEPLFKKIKPLFQPKTSIAKDLKEIKSKYPKLKDEFPILSQIVPDNYKPKETNKVIKVNLKLTAPLKDKDEVDNAVNQMRELLQFNSPKYTPEQQIEIQRFADKLTKFIIIQSGLNPSVYNLLDIVPNEAYTNLIKHKIKQVKSSFDKDKNTPLDKSFSFAAIKKFYNKWKTQRPSFFEFKENEEGELPPVNFQNQRGIDLYVSESDITGEKKAQFEEKLLQQAKILPQMSNIIDRVTLQVARNAPKTLFITSKQDGEIFQKQKQSNYLSVDISSKEDVDKFINNLLAKSLDYSQISLQAKGYLQDQVNSELFDYFSQRLYDATNIPNPNFQNQKDLLPSQEMEEQPIQQVESKEVKPSEQIYPQLGNKTQSENVILPKDVDPEADNIGMVYTTAIDFWRKIVPEAMTLYNKSKPLIVAFRGNSKKTFLQNYNSGSHTIGNPFNWQDESGSRKEQGIKSTKKFIDWMITGNNLGNQDATEEYRQAIINDIKSGKIKKSPILYYEEKGYATHATALDYLINKYDWNQSKSEVKPVSGELSQPTSIQEENKPEGLPPIDRTNKNCE